MLGQLFNEYIRASYTLSHFPRSITVVLKEQDESDYQLAKSYRPVALLNTVSKFMEAVAHDNSATPWKPMDYFQMRISVADGASPRAVLHRM